MSAATHGVAIVSNQVSAVFRDDRTEVGRAVRELAECVIELAAECEALQRLIDARTGDRV